jgi:hypothetical protein
MYGVTHLIPTVPSGTRRHPMESITSTTLRPNCGSSRVHWSDAPDRRGKGLYMFLFTTESTAETTKADKNLKQGPLPPQPVSLPAILIGWSLPSATDPFRKGKHDKCGPAYSVPCSCWLFVEQGRVRYHTAHRDLQERFVAGIHTVFRARCFEVHAACTSFLVFLAVFSITAAYWRVFAGNPRSSSTGRGLGSDHQADLNFPAVRRNFTLPGMGAVGKNQL